MTARQLFEMAKELGAEDYNLCLSKYILFDEAEEISAILDVPLNGIAQNDDDKELRIVIYSNDFDKVVKLLGDKAKITPMTD